MTPEPGRTQRSPNDDLANSTFSPNVMKHFIATLLSAALFSTGAAAQPIPIYENFGNVTTTPQIDAIAFANYGDFSVSSMLPYDFQSTRFFTNRGAMTGFPGFRFATATSLGTAFTPATNFLNDVGGVITAGSFGGFQIGGVILGPGLISQSTTPSYLLVSAENVVNRGIMMAGGGGLLQVVGKNVDLSRSGLGIGRLELSSTHFVTDSNFFPDPGVLDNYWALTNQFDMRVANLINAALTDVVSPRHDVTNSPTFQFPISVQVGPISITNPATSLFSVYTNSGGADPETGRITNIYRQAVFVAVSDTNLAFDVKWTPSNIATNPYQTAIVELSLADTNVVTGDLEFSTLYLRDMLASWTNYVVLTNLQTMPQPTMRPATFELTRTPPFEFLMGADGNSTSLTNFFFDAADTNFVPIVTNLYAGYSAEIDSLASRPPNVAGLQITEFPGRVEIEAENLDLSRTRLRGSALVSVKTTNLVASRGVQVDSESVIYDLGVPNGIMNLQGIAKERVVRLNGPVNAWSAIWTNFMGVMTTNQVDDGAGGLTNVVTNIVTEIDYHMLIVDATGLQATKPVSTHDFFVRANEVILNDPLTVVRGFRVDAEALTLNNRLTLLTVVTNWTSTNAPSLRALTNKGTLSIPNVANFGQDMGDGYESFSNLGLIEANGFLIRSREFGNSGMLTSRVDGIRIEAETAQFQDASTLSARDFEISASDLRFTASTNAARGKLVLRAERSLSDTGEGANNLFITMAGFQLPVKPALGDLLGTTIQSFGPRFALVDHLWAGENRGASASGFQDNVAIGHLVLDGDRDVLMSFRGATGDNGMYIDFLELAGPLAEAVDAGDLGAALFIDPSLTIYFAESNVPAEQLEELSGGRLVQVDFAGASTFVEVSVRAGGDTVQMERVVRMSATVDSDGDGIANAYDAYPLDFDTPLILHGTRANGETSINLSWPAEPQVQYVIEFTSSLQGGSWEVLSTFTNSDTLTQAATVSDKISGDHAQRYYRVRMAQ